MPRGRVREPLEQRYFAKIAKDPSGDCLLWTGALTNGYGRISLGGAHPKSSLAHRLAYELAKGAIPDGLQIDHLCRNRNCVNPDHLEAVTAAENVARGHSPSAMAIRTGHCKRGHPFNDASAGPNGGRSCRECRRAYDAKRAQMRRAASKAATQINSANVIG